MKFFQKIFDWLDRRAELKRQRRIEAGQCPEHAPGHMCMKCAVEHEHPKGCQCYYCVPYR